VLVQEYVVLKPSFIDNDLAIDILKRRIKNRLEIDCFRPSTPSTLDNAVELGENIRRRCFNGAPTPLEELKRLEEDAMIKAQHMREGINKAFITWIGMAMTLDYEKIQALLKVGVAPEVILTASLYQQKYNPTTISKLLMSLGVLKKEGGKDPEEAARRWCKRSLSDINESVNESIKAARKKCDQSLSAISEIFTALTNGDIDLLHELVVPERICKRRFGSYTIELLLKNKTFVFNLLENPIASIRCLNQTSNDLALIELRRMILRGKVVQDFQKSVALDLDYIMDKLSPEVNSQVMVLMQECLEGLKSNFQAALELSEIGEKESYILPEIFQIYRVASLERLGRFNESKAIATKLLKEPLEIERGMGILLDIRRDFAEYRNDYMLIELSYVALEERDEQGLVPLEALELSQKHLEPLEEREQTGELGGAEKTYLLERLALEMWRAAFASKTAKNFIVSDEAKKRLDLFIDSCSSIMEVTSLIKEYRSHFPDIDPILSLIVTRKEA